MNADRSPAPAARAAPTELAGLEAQLAAVCEDYAAGRQADAEVEAAALMAAISSLARERDAAQEQRRKHLAAKQEAEAVADHLRARAEAGERLRERVGALCLAVERVAFVLGWTDQWDSWENDLPPHVGTLRIATRDARAALRAESPQEKQQTSHASAPGVPLPEDGDDAGGDAIDRAFQWLGCADTYHRLRDLYGAKFVMLGNPDLLYFCPEGGGSAKGAIIVRHGWWVRDDGAGPYVTMDAPATPTPTTPPRKVIEALATLLRAANDLAPEDDPDRYDAWRALVVSARLEYDALRRAAPSPEAKPPPVHMLDLRRAAATACGDVGPTSGIASQVTCPECRAEAKPTAPPACPGDGCPGCAGCRAPSDAPAEAKPPATTREPARKDEP